VGFEKKTRVIFWGRFFLQQPWWKVVSLSSSMRELAVFFIFSLP